MALTTNHKLSALAIFVLDKHMYLIPCCHDDSAHSRTTIFTVCLCPFQPKGISWIIELSKLKIWLATGWVKNTKNMKGANNFECMNADWPRIMGHPLPNKCNQRLERIALDCFYSFSLEKMRVGCLVNSF